MSELVSDLISYQCNICGGINEFVSVGSLDRESGPCRHCKAQVRLRAITHLVSQTMFGQSMPVKYWPDSKHIKGIGISDWNGYNNFYNEKIEYLNCQYHEEPYLDVRSPPEYLVGTADFVSCSDVFEHVEPPIDAAFAGLCSLLKLGGWLIFSVPFTYDKTVEHFPDLYEWNVEEGSHGYVLNNTTRNGHKQKFENLCFHGGPGQVLEMRIFGLDDIVRKLDAAGFGNINIFKENISEFGIRFSNQYSLPIVAQRRK